MLKEILGYIFILGLIAFYIYYGSHLSSNFKESSEIIIFYIAYVLFGITLLNMVMVSVYWEVLSKKRGPPGPRGIMGESGDEGGEGHCTLDHNIMFALLKIKEAVANIVNDNTGDNVKLEDIYNKDENRLTNSMFDGVINRIVQSKEFDTILLRPDTNDTIKYGKTLKDITGYLKSIIGDWSLNMINMPGGIDFFVNIDGSFTDTVELEKYFHNEIEKYDIWYWGGTRVFKPMEIEVMRQTQFASNGDSNNMMQNSAFPMEDLPLIDIMEIKYSDNDTSNLEWLWGSKGLNEPLDNFSGWRNNSPGIYSEYIKPAIYIPKVKTINNKRYYPIGCVMIEEDENNKTNKIKKTLLVSGDVIIPKNLTLMWLDRKQQNALKGGNEPSDGHTAGVFYRLESDNINYKTLGDIFHSNGGNDKERKNFLDKLEENKKRLIAKFNFNNPELYTGPVALPISVLTEIAKKNVPEWSYKFNGSRFYHSRNQIDLFIGNNNSYNILRLQNATYNNKPLTASNGGQIGNKSSSGGKLYTINMEKLKIRNNPLKETEAENNDLGFGYYGYPYLMTDKYSIFNFLDLVPEGLIINYNNNRKLYLRHYGGKDINRYNIFKYDTDTNRFDKALCAYGPTNISFKRLKPNDPRFSFTVFPDDKDTRFLRFSNYAYPDDGYLKYISQLTNTNYDNAKNERPGGISIDHTNSTFKLEKGKGLLSENNAKLFMFLPAHGRGFNENNKELKRIDFSKHNYPGANKNYTPTATTNTTL